MEIRHQELDETLMSIRRISGGSKGRAKTVIWNQTVWTVGVAPGRTVAEQTQNLLTKLEASLIEAGTDKSRIIEATIYLKDMSAKTEMDKVWCNWIPNDGWPCRACVGAVLAPGDLVEIKLTAALPPA